MVKILLSVVILSGLAFAASAQDESVPNPPAVDGWSQKYSENKDQTVVDFCVSNNADPICKTLVGPCTSKTVGECVENELKKLPGGADDAGEAGLWAQFKTLIVSFISAMLGLLTAWVLKLRLDDIKTLNAKLTAFMGDFLDRKSADKPTDLHVHGEFNMVLLGVGGTGKTSIVRAMASMSKADPSIATQNLKLYTLASDVGLYGPHDKPAVQTAITSERRSRVRVKVNVIDTVGQRIQDISGISGFLPDRPTVAVLVVDLFAPVGNTAPDPYQDKVDQRRIKAQMEAFSPQVLRFIFTEQNIGIRNLAGVIVFVNKVDLLQKPFREAIEVGLACGTKFAQTVDDTLDVSTPVVVVGSAAMGLGVSGFRDDQYQPFRYSTLLEVATAMWNKRKQ